MIPLSVVVCTHDPRPDYLARTLEAIRGQTLPGDQWELLVIDNASAEPLAGRLDLSWHSSVRVVREETIGLIHARIRGLNESRGEIIVFVDDDNVLDPDYLETTLKIARERPFIGVWNGSVRPEFAVEPPASVRPYIHNSLAVSVIDRDYWTNMVRCDFPPFGAGMSVRRPVAEAWLNNVARDPLRQSLGRRGPHGLESGEDDDLALSSIALGLGFGRFHALRLTHLIPAHRLTEDYIVRLLARSAWSRRIIDALYPPPFPEIPPCRMHHLLKLWYRCIVSPPLPRRIFLATRRAEKEADEFIARVRNESANQTPLS
jgi:glycosyltransferase involved in cell wall biosynthesis